MIPIIYKKLGIFAITFLTIIIFSLTTITPAKASELTAYDFFASLPNNQGSDALNVLYTSPIASHTHKNNINDATSIENMKKSIPYMKKCNEIRKQEGLQELKVNYTLLAISMSLSNYSVNNIEHAKVFNVGENLAWGTHKDPFIVWYDEEKLDYINNTSEETGHYLNIINPNYVYTGFAITNGGPYNIVHEQSFAMDWFGEGQILRPPYTNQNMSIVLTSSTANATMSVEEYENTLNDFITNPTKNNSNIEMHRLYNPNSGEHFYTSNIDEKNYLTSIGWNYENIGWIAPKASNTPVYRLYNPNAGDHHYTTSIIERNYLISVGWNDEGIGWFSDDNKSKPLYRQYNPYAISGSHNYTLDKYENDYLSSIGWKEEGISWYGV